MSLRLMAESDLSKILEGEVGFRWEMTLTDPAGTSYPGLHGFSNDIGQVIAPGTRTAVSGRAASIAIRIGLLVDVGAGLPRGINDSSVKPWYVQFDDINGNPWYFKITASMPDRALGIVTCMLEQYQPPVVTP